MTRPDDADPNDETSRRLDPPDPAQKFGAAAAEDAELADRVARGRDDADAEEAFDREARGPVPTETAHPRDGQ